MKCRSVACIWSDSPPLQKVTATAVLDQPPTLYTGGSDGSIVWWNISSSDSKQDLKPIAMLCGHAAPIADLDICFPTAVSGDGEIDDSSNVASNSNSINYGALISACTGGVLCIWSRSSGHCRRRRKLPAWVGIPSMVKPVPENRRYICIACCFVDSFNLFGHESFDSIEGGVASPDGESQHKKPSKCTVVIVDSYTLTIVQTVFHGNLSIGSLKFMAIVLSIGDMEKQSVMMVDSLGKVQGVPIIKDSDPNVENATGSKKNSSNLEMDDWVDGSSEGELGVAFATRGQVLAIVYRTHCIFRLVDVGTTIGEISFLDGQLCIEGSTTLSHVIGGMFLDSDYAISGESHNIFLENFAVWNNIGSAVVYTISYSDGIFKFEPQFSIPAVLHPPDVRLSICFHQLKCYLLRIESICFHNEVPLLWRPHVTLWLLPRPHDKNAMLCIECKMLGEGSFFDGWIVNSTYKTEGLWNAIDIKPQSWENGSTSQQSYVPPYLESVDGVSANEKYGFYQEERLVSSSVVIAENYHTPYAIVYGFYSGGIKVVQFGMFFEGMDSSGGSPRPDADSRISEQYLLGHTGPVLCLAAHRMVNTSTGSSFNHILLSGSMDCTVRVWDLDSSNLIIVMHQHVAPVRQIILPPPGTGRPWRDCFLSVGEDSCVVLASFDTLRVERIFPGHPNYPAKVVWDGTRGYLACFCPNHSGASDSLDVLYIWDIKTGARERVLRGTASHSMFDHFCRGINLNSHSGHVMHRNTSASSFLLPTTDDSNFAQSNLKSSISNPNMAEPNSSQARAGKGSSAELSQSKLSIFQSNKHPVESSCPFPGIATLSFDLVSLMSLCQKPELFKHVGDMVEKPQFNEMETETPKDGGDYKKENIHMNEGVQIPSPHHRTIDDDSKLHGTSGDDIEDYNWVRSLEGYVLQFSLSFLHLWNVDDELDKLLITEMKLKRPENFIVAPGLVGDRGSLTLAFPGPNATLELWKSSSEFCAMRSLTMVSLAQHMISWSHSCSAASSALAAFYTRNFAEKIPDVKPPSLQLLVSFWQHECEHVRMAARSLFHCAASRAIPPSLRSPNANDHTKLLGSSNRTVECEHENSSVKQESTSSLNSDTQVETREGAHAEDAEILAWLESFEMQDWISCVGGTSQDAVTSHILVAAALAIWYPSLVKPSLALLVVHPLMKLVMAMNEKYSSTAAEILADGMESTWYACIASEIPHLIADIFFQVECVSGASAYTTMQNPTTPLSIWETLVHILLPSVAMADIPGFLNVIESQIWSTASDSPVHVVSLMTLIRVVRGSPRNLAQYLDKVVTFILQTMDPGNSVMRRTCLQSSRAALKEIVRVFPMVALNDTSTRLAVGDAIGEINNASIRVYDMQSMTKIKVLDASGPPGLPSLLGRASEMAETTAISALSFSPDGEGLVAFSENGLMIRWWSLGSVWWEKLSRNLVPVQCTKLIFVPPWDGFSPNSTRSSIMASVMGKDRQANLQENTRRLSEMDRLKHLIHNLDLSYRLEWVGERKVKLARHGHELGTFQL